MQFILSAITFTLLFARISCTDIDENFCAKDTCDDDKISDVLLNANDAIGANDADLEVAGVIDRSLNSLDQSDPVLVEAIRTRFLVAPPATPTLNLTSNVRMNPNALKGQFGQPIEVDRLYR